MLYCKFCLLLLIVDSIAQKWMTFEANEYFYDSDPNGTVGYDQAVEICNDYNATLAIITSQEQNQFIVDDLTGKQRELIFSADESRRCCPILMVKVIVFCNLL